MIILKEARHLTMLKCFYNEAMDVYVFHCAGKKVSLQHVTPEQIAAIFRKAQVKDETTEPRSSRGKTYLEMVADIISGGDSENWMWDTYVDTFFNACRDIVAARVGQKNEKAPLSRKLLKFKESGNLPAIAQASGLSTNPKITDVQRKDTILSTCEAMGLKTKVNAAKNVVAEVPDMQTAGTVLSTIYQQFGVKGSFMVTWEGKGKLYWAPDVPVDKKIALAYAKAANLPPPNSQRYLA